MYLHLGNDVAVRKTDILGVFDLDNSSQSIITRKFLSAAEKAGQVINAAGAELPKSFVLCEARDGQRVYLCQLNASTLQRRSESLGIET